MQDLKIFRFLMAACIFGITSCTTGNDFKYLTAEDPGTATIKIYKNNNSTSKNRFIAPKNVTISQTYQTLSGKLTSELSFYCPSVGDVNLLVIPVKTPGDKNKWMDDEKRATIKSDIETAFFGTTNEKFGYKSVKDFYKESSFNKLNLSGKVTDWFDVKANTTVQKYAQMTGSYDGTIANEILLKAIEWAKETQNIDLKEFDKNEDGFIDAVYLVYDEFDAETQVQYELLNYSYYDEKTLNMDLMDITYQNIYTMPEEGKDPVPSSFSWLSFASLYKGYAQYDENAYPNFDNLLENKFSTQSFIHEQGHLFGLEDYASSTNSAYHPIGRHSMMDIKVCDLDSYSKMTLGWITPYVVYGTSEILLPKANFADNCVIVIPSKFETISTSVENAIANETIDSFTYEFNPFSEYIMIDLYSPDGLNYQDAFGDVMYGYRPSSNGSGVRIYHVDSRIFKANVVESDYGITFNYVDGYEWNGKSFDKNQMIFAPISNSEIEQTSYQLPYEFNKFDRIRLLEATQINTFDEGGWTDYTTYFKKGSEPFEIETFGYRFFNVNYTYNDGNLLPFKVSVETLKEVKF